MKKCGERSIVEISTKVECKRLLKAAVLGETTFMWQRLKTKFKNMKLAGKMVVVYFILAGVTCCISIVGLQASLNIYDKKLYEKSLQELDFFTQKVNEELKDVENLSYTIAMNENVQEHLKKARAMKYLSNEYYYELYQIRNILQDELMIHPIVKNIIYEDRERVTFIVGTYCGETDDEIYHLFLEKCKENIGGYTTADPMAGYPFLVSGRDILERKNARLNYLGTFVLTSDVSGMIEKTRKVLEVQDSDLFVYGNGSLIYGEKENAPRNYKVERDQGYEIVKSGGEKYFLCYLKSPINGWTYVNSFPYSQIFGQTMLLRYLMLGGFLLIFICIAGVLLKIARVITRPLDQLTESMKIVEDGNFQKAKEVLPRETSQDEVGVLSQEFWIMLDRIDVLIHENYEKQLLLKDTKYKMLQAQINPHFLYNTLNALNWMVKAGQNTEAGRMIVELGSLLRASFDKEPYTTIKEEVDSAKSYITIQQFRYQKRANFVIEAGENIDSYMIPRMTLQPLIENAIYYGVEKVLTICTITVGVHEVDNRIVIEVKDTGAGMTEEELNDVRNFTFKPQGHGIGLRNIRERLNIAYEDSEFLIESRLGEGTKVTIRIPKVEREETDA